VKPVVRPAARGDILRQYQYYIFEGAYDAAGRFIDAVDISIAHLSGMPETGAPRISSNPILSGLRSWPVKGFEDIRIYYLIQNEEIRIVRVLHGRRDIQNNLEND
jgi:toxin ParE1/3/4